VTQLLDLVLGFALGVITAVVVLDVARAERRRRRGGRRR
jgi:hypothetical protein